MKKILLLIPLLLLVSCGRDVPPNNCREEAYNACGENKVRDYIYYNDTGRCKFVCEK